MSADSNVSPLKLATTALYRLLWPKKVRYASAHDPRGDESRCAYGRYVEAEHHERRERQLREHRKRDGQEHAWWIGYRP
jgi:hypothetical protein